MGIRIRWTWGVVMVVVVAAVGWSEAQTTSTECITTLTACEAPLKNSSVTPSSKCCNPLKDAVKNQTECLCQLFNNPTLLLTYGVTTDQIFNLTARCNISDASPSMCSAGPASSPGIFTASPPGKNSGSTYDVVVWSGIALILAVMTTLVF